MRQIIGECELCSKLARVVDHCHVFQRIRGLLCYKCNSSLGWFEQRRVSGIINSDNLFDPYIEKYRRLHESGECALWHEVRKRISARYNAKPESAEKRRRYYQKCKADPVFQARIRERQRLNQQRYSIKKKSSGLCRRCGRAPLVIGMAACQRCLENTARISRRRRMAIKLRGMLPFHATAS